MTEEELSDKIAKLNKKRDKLTNEISDLWRVLESTCTHKNSKPDTQYVEGSWDTRTKYFSFMRCMTCGYKWNETVKYGEYV